MKKYRGPQADDEKPIGGGSYNKQELGHEAFNFLPLDCQGRLHMNSNMKSWAVAGSFPRSTMLTG
jgi:hypothetical protein